VFVSFSFYFYLKQILSAVLDSTPFAFSIRLAAAASRKDHSHLEKWLAEKLILYNESFIEVICMIMP
jgi:CCR4-NOT transcription complex subunit 1